MCRNNTFCDISSGWIYSKICVKRPLSKRPKIGFQDKLSLNAGQKYCRMLPMEHSAILLTFIKLTFVIKIFVLSILEWLFYTGFTVHCLMKNIQGFSYFFDVGVRGLLRVEFGEKSIWIIKSWEDLSSLNYWENLISILDRFKRCKSVKCCTGLHKKMHSQLDSVWGCISKFLDFSPWYQGFARNSNWHITSWRN